MKNNIKVLLVDDEVLFRKGIAFILEREEDIEVVYEASNGKELIDFLETTTEHPDIILTDLKMPLLNGVEATKLIHVNFPNIKIIALSSYDSKSFVANMIDVGAVSYLVKNATPQELLKTIREVHNVGFYYNNYVMEVIKETVLDGANKRPFEIVLTNRENEVLQLICDQKTTAEIAEILFLSPRTVEGHRNNLLLKTTSKNIAGLVVFAIQNKIILIYD
ncbi:MULTISPECIES: response regulator transcription factor [unclassified Flavobacterium]|uniref:response regulator transcription factor n=1 Tax=unclassified Flavobacterium TaxID=196869 RepID=UPI00156FC6FD|nr:MULTISPECIES: response regulator transcription factor [unclassified Flavobacterium]MBE0393413.1 Transcriptional regulatory protein DegU [Flavobacterium sp. PL002]NRT15400.1 DNA-binding NarL/FixJ family response regulator [Flavobacterium sp. 28A]